MRTLARLASAARVVGTVAAFGASLLFVRASLGKLLALAERIAPMPKMRMDIVAWRTEPTTTFRSWCLLVVIVGALVWLHETVSWLVRRWPLAVVALEAAVLALACTMAFRASAFVGWAFMLALGPLSVLFAPFALPTRAGRRTRARDESDPLFVTLSALQILPLGWGIWMTTFERSHALVVGCEVAALAFTAWRVSAPRAQRAEEALLGLAFVPLPLVGLLREPGRKWVLMAMVAYLAAKLAAAVARQRGSPLRLARAGIADVTVIATVWSVCAIFVAPYRFRDLPRLNHIFHESEQFASINSIAHGKLMMADAGLIYGPLRSYALALYLRFAGMTAEQVRLGEALMTLASLGILLGLGWWLVERRAAAMVWYASLLLVGTYVANWVNYHDIISFGWADLGRIAIPLLATVGAVRAILASDAKRFAGATTARLAGWGAMAAIATLWAQEFGACTVAAVFASAVLHFALIHGPVRTRARLLAATTGSYAGGLLAGAALYLGIYALFGRAGSFLGTVTAQSAAFASGSYGALPFPLDESTFLALAPLIKGAPHKGVVFEYALPPAVYLFTLAALVLRASARRWGARETVTLSLLLFGMASFRFAVGRSDYPHLMTVAAPAVLLTVRLCSQGVFAVHASRAATRALGVATAGIILALGCGEFRLSGYRTALKPRLAGIFGGTERPSSGAPYDYPGIPRAGDILVDAKYVPLVHAIAANSSPSDGFFQHVGYMDGGELYFLADRPNPTRFDVLAELLTTERQHEAFVELSREPPKLIVGEDWGMTGAELNDFIKAHYHSIGDFDGLHLVARND